MINLALVFRSLVLSRRTCHSNQFLLILSTKLIHWTQAASGASGPAKQWALLCVRLRLVQLKRKWKLEKKYIETL